MNKENKTNNKICKDFKVTGDAIIDHITDENHINCLQEEKDKISPFRIGDEVVCYWGSGGYDQKGMVIDNLVLYNNYMAFSPEKCELGCIIRLEKKILPTGFEVGNNEVIPFRQIKKVSKE